MKVLALKTVAYSPHGGPCSSPGVSLVEVDLAARDYASAVAECAAQGLRYVMPLTREPRGPQKLDRDAQDELEAALDATSPAALAPPSLLRPKAGGRDHGRSGQSLAACTMRTVKRR